LHRIRELQLQLDVKGALAQADAALQRWPDDPALLALRDVFLWQLSGG
jgi:hypothetical protein